MASISAMPMTVFYSLISWDLLITQGSQLLRKPSCFILKASIVNRCKPGFVALVWCCVRASVPQQFWCYLISLKSVTALGPTWWKKLRFHCPCKTLCALVTLDQRHLINDQIYLPARAVFLADSSLPALLFPGAPQMWGRGQVAGRKGALAATSLFLATVFLAGPSASSESLVLSSQLVTVALKEGCNPRNREVHPLQAGGVSVLGDR